MNTNLRHISYCLIASLLFVACRKESHPLTPEEPEQPEQHYPICMDASSTDMTTSRALVTNDADLQGTNLGVFAYKQLADGTKVSVFDNEKVYHKGSVWTYDNTKYWDRTAHYYFVSYSPHQESDVTFENGTLTISNIPNWQAIDAKAKDYVVADDHGEAQGGYITANGVRAVPLDFKHILCQLEVRVAKNAFLSSTYTLSGISYTNVPVLDGTANYTCLLPGKDESGANREEAEGSMALGEAGFSSTAQLMAELNNVVVPSDPDEDKSTTIKHLVVPFKTNDNIKITLDYKVNVHEPDDAVVDTKLNELTENKRYVLTLIFNSGADVETKLEILDWVNEDVDEDKYNW